MDSPDLQGKYQKLASEYSKLRAQNQVLKKAVIEEQGKTTQLKETIKSKDQTLRKVEQEIDSLNFRNQQLSKRLVLLQDDLEQYQIKSRNGQTTQLHEPKSNYSMLDNNVYAEELQSKISENAKLHAEISDLDYFYKNKVVDLENKLEKAIKESNRSSDNNKSQELILQNELRKIKLEKSKQGSMLQQKEADMAVLQNTLRDLMAMKNDSPKSEDMQTTPDSSQNIRFSPGTLNLDSPNRNYLTGKLCRMRLLTDLKTPMKNISENFVEFFISYHNLLKTSPALTPIQSKQADQLLEENETWQVLFKSYEQILKNVNDNEEFVSLESLKGFESFSKAMENCSNSLKKLLPILCENFNLKDDQIHSPWKNSLGTLVGILLAIIPYLSSLSAHSEGRTCLSPVAISKILGLLSGRLNKLNSISQELVTAWDILVAGWSSTAVSPSRNQEKISKSLQNIAEAFSKIYLLFSENVACSSSQGSSSASTPSSSFSGVGHNTTTNFPALVSPVPGTLGSPESLGWSVSMQDCLNFADSEASLAQQLAQATSRLTKLEEEREYWRLEYQLLNHKYEKQLKKCEDLEKKVEESSFLKEDNSSSGFSSSKDHSPANSIEENVGTVFSSANNSMPCASEREKEIRNHFTNRCSHLYMQLTSCTSQSALYQNECETLIKRLADSEESKILFEQKIDLQRKEVANIQENLNTTSRNYEEQISTMSEHLADLNEKITSQADFIEHLKFESKKKGKK